MIKQFQLGEKVRLSAIPPGLEDFPDLPTKSTFEKCLGREFTVTAITENGWYELPIGSVTGNGGEKIYVPPEFLQRSFRRWRVLDRTRLTLVLMEELAGNARVSFEGELGSSRLMAIPGASQESTGTWTRITVPLEPQGGSKIISALGGTVPKAVVHLQIEKDGTLQFAAYDNFHPECIYFGPAIPPTIIESLVDQKSIKAIRYGEAFR